MLFIEMHLIIKMCIIQLVETNRSPQIDLEVRETFHQKLRFFEHSPSGYLQKVKPRSPRQYHRERQRALMLFAKPRIDSTLNYPVPLHH